MFFQNFFSKIDEGSIPLTSLVIVVIIAVFVLVFLVAVIFYLLRKLRDKTRPTYGFGGKTLYSLIIVTSAIFSVFLSINVVVETSDYLKIAKEEKRVYIDIRKIQKDGGDYLITFMAVPETDGKIWAKGSYDIYWALSGEKELQYAEYDRNSQDFSFFSVRLPSGSYIVSVIVEGEDFIVTEETTFDL